MIQIVSRKRLRKMAAKNPGVHEAVVISEPDYYMEMANPERQVKDILPNLKDYIHSQFFDIEFEGRDAPKVEQIKEILEWAKGRENLLVACRAGISRSSAVAYLIEWEKRGDAAVDILDVDRHQPNRLIIDHGKKILGDQVEEGINRFLAEMYGRYL